MSLQNTLPHSDWRQSQETIFETGSLLLGHTLKIYGADRTDGLGVDDEGEPPAGKQLKPLLADDLAFIVAAGLDVEFKATILIESCI